MRVPRWLSRPRAHQHLPLQRAQHLLLSQLGPTSLWSGAKSAAHLSSQPVVHVLSPIPVFQVPLPFVWLVCVCFLFVRERDPNWAGAHHRAPKHRPQATGKDGRSPSCAHLCPPAILPPLATRPCCMARPLAPHRRQAAAPRPRCARPLTPPRPACPCRGQQRAASRPSWAQSNAPSYHRRRGRPRALPGRRAMPPLSIRDAGGLAPLLGAEQCLPFPRRRARRGPFESGCLAATRRIMWLRMRRRPRHRKAAGDAGLRRPMSPPPPP